MNAPQRTLRLALAMRGGVSLSVWIGGAVHEIDRTRRLVSPATNPPDTETPASESDVALNAVFRRLGRVAGIEIDVLAGTSAGGLNGVILASALRTGRSLDPLRQVWLDAADLQRIQRPVDTRDRLSLLDGQVFYDTLRDVLMTKFFAHGDPAPEGQRLDLLLPVTLLDGLAVTAADDPTTPVTERRHDAVVHIRHHGPQPGWSDLVAAGPDDQAGVQHVVATLAAAARATASFPAGFEPFIVPQPDSPSTELKGTLLTPVPRRIAIQLIDGGVLDNIPVAKAVRAIAAAAADHPTERWLFYLQPNPPLDTTGPTDGTGTADDTAPTTVQPAAMTAVLTSLAGALVNESLIDDLETLRSHNEEVVARQAERTVLLRRPLTGTPAEDRSRFEAECLVATLDRPHEEIGWWPIGVDVPGSQLAGWSTDARAALGTQIVDATAGVGATEALRPFEPIIRIGALLVEWARDIEQSAADPGAVGWCKRLAYLVAAWAEQGAGLADIAWLTALPTSPAKFDGATAVAARRASVGSVEADLDLPGPDSGDDLGLTSMAGTAALIGGTTADAADGGPHRVAISARLLDALGGIARSLAGNTTLPGGELNPLASMLTPLIRAVPDDQIVGRLIAIDAQLAPLHRGRALRDIAPIRYRTISGASPTIFATPASAEDDSPIIGPAASHRFASLTRVGSGLQAPIRPSTKLAGNQISSFSAFLFRHWRANDWMWGRADAVRTLVETILDPVTVRSAVETEGPDQVLELMRAYVTSPFGEGTAAGAAGVAENLWTDNRDALHEALRTPAASTDPSAADPIAILRELVIARRQLEIFAVELARTGSDALIAEGPGWQRPQTREPTDPLDERMDRWDRSIRRLGDIWGRRELTETGLRATLVGWKALLVDQGWPVRLVVAPLLAPVPLMVLGGLLARRRALAGMAMLSTFVVLPRMHDHAVGRGLFAAATVLGVGGLLWLMRSRSPTEPPAISDMVRGFNARWAWVAIAVALYAVVVAARPSLWAGARSPDARTALLSAPYLVPAVAAAFAAVLLWCWAWWLPRLVLAGFTAGTTLLWVWLSAPEACDSVPADGGTCGLQGAGAYLSSMWWGVIVVLYVSTWAASIRDFGRERHDAGKAAVAARR